MGDLHVCTCIRKAGRRQTPPKIRENYSDGFYYYPTHLHWNLFILILKTFNVEGYGRMCVMKELCVGFIILPAFFGRSIKAARWIDGWIKSELLQSGNPRLSLTPPPQLER